MKGNSFQVHFSPPPIPAISTTTHTKAPSRTFQQLWAEAVATAVLLKNISPTKALPNITPAEAWTGKKPSASSLRVFGCKAYVHVVTCPLHL